MSIFSNFFKKEAPLLGLQGSGGGLGFLAGGGAAEYLDATGGTIFEIGDYRWHIINSSLPPQSIAINQVASDPNDSVIDFLVVAGGGGAGGGDNAYGGGGGAGGVIFRPGKPITTTGGPYPVTIGSGGSGLPIDNSNPGGQPSTDGSDTVIGSSPDPIYFIAKGGGGGASGAGYQFGTGGRNGGSGGGGGGGASGNPSFGTATQPNQPGDSGTYGHGYNGGGTGGGGGGGGAGNAGGNQGLAGNGLQVPEPFLPPSVPSPFASAISYYSAGDTEFRYFGGGGQMWGPGISPGGGNSRSVGGVSYGLGGGGLAAPSDPLSSTPPNAHGANGKGAGGASLTSNNPRSYAGDGGDGIIIFKYKFQ